MSTRCHVQVIQENAGWEEMVTLYHHSDGYPSNILPLLRKAYALTEGGWEAGRAGKVAGFICCTDPGAFEPQSDNEIQPDAEYLYKVFCFNPGGGHMNDRPRWEVEVYHSTDWEPKNWTLVAGRENVIEASAEYVKAVGE